ncbi:MAG: hypothetical protein AAF228_12160, partial [Pseudomonadota bacterium]
MSSESSIDPYSGRGDSSFYESDTTETFQSSLWAKSSVALTANTTAPANASASGSADPDFAFKLAPEAFDIFFGDKTYHGNNFASDAGVSTSFSSAFYLESSNGSNPPQGRYAVGVVSLNGENQMVMVDKETGTYTIINKDDLAEHDITIDGITGEITLAEDILFLDILDNGTLNIISINDFGGAEITWSFDFAEHSSADTFDAMLAGKQAHAEDNFTLSFNETLDPAEYLEIDDQFYFSSAKIEGEYVWFLAHKDTGEITFVDFSTIEKFYVELDTETGTLGISNEGYQLEVITVPNEDGTIEARIQVSTEGGSVPWYSDTSGSYLNVFNGSHTVVPIYFEGLTSIGASLTTGDAMIAGGAKYIESPDGFFRGVLTIDGGLLIIDTRTYTIIEQIETGAVGDGLKLFSNGELKSYKSGDNKEDGVPLGTGNDAVDSNTFELQLNGGAFQIVDTRFDPAQDDGLLWDSSLVTDKTDWMTGIVGIASELFTGTDLGSELATGDVLKAGDGNFLSISEDTDGDGTVDVNYRTMLLSDGRLLTYDMISKTVVTEATIDTGLTDALLEVRSDGAVYIFSEADGSVGFDTSTSNENTNRSDFSFSLEIYTDNTNTETARLSLYDAQENAVLWRSDEGTLGKAADNPSSGGGSKDDPTSTPSSASGSGSSSEAEDNNNKDDKEKDKDKNKDDDNPVSTLEDLAGLFVGLFGASVGLSGAMLSATRPASSGGTETFTQTILRTARGVYNDAAQTLFQRAASAAAPAGEIELPPITPTYSTALVVQAAIESPPITPKNYEVAQVMKAGAVSLQKQIELAEDATNAIQDAETVDELGAGVSALKDATRDAALKLAEVSSIEGGVSALVRPAALLVAGIMVAIGAVVLAQSELGSSDQINSDLKDIKSNNDIILQELQNSGSAAELNEAATQLFYVVTDLNETLVEIQSANVDAVPLQGLVDLSASIASNYAGLANSVAKAAKTKSSTVASIPAAELEVENPLVIDSDAVDSRIYYPAAANMYAGLSDDLLNLADDTAATNAEVSPINSEVHNDVKVSEKEVKTIAAELAKTENLRKLKNIKQLFEQEQVSPYFEELPDELKTAVDELLLQIDAKLDALGEVAEAAEVDDKSVDIANQASIISKQLQSAASEFLQDAQASLGKASISLEEISAYYVSNNLESLSQSYKDASDEVNKIYDYTNQIQLLKHIGEGLAEFINTQIYTAEQQFDIENPRPDITDPIKANVDAIMQSLQNLNTISLDASKNKIQTNTLAQDATNKIFALVKTQIPELSELYTQIYGLQELAKIDGELFNDQQILNATFEQITSDVSAINGSKDSIIRFDGQIESFPKDDTSNKKIGAEFLSLAAAGIPAAVLSPEVAEIAPISAIALSVGSSLMFSGQTVLNNFQIKQAMGNIALPQINAARFLNDPRTATTLSDPSEANAKDTKGTVSNLFNTMDTLQSNAHKFSDRESFNELIHENQILDTELSTAIKQLYTSDMVEFVAHNSSDINALMNQLVAIEKMTSAYPGTFDDLNKTFSQLMVQIAAAQLNSSAQPTSHQQKASRQISTNLAQIATDDTKDQENIFASELATLDDFMDFWVAGQIAPLTALVQEYISDASTDEEIAAVISNVASDYGLDAATYMKDTLNGNHQLTPELREADEAIRTMASKMADLVSYDAIADGYTAEDARALANETYDDMIESYFPIYG